MKPDRETYEAWLLDRMEGRLSPAQDVELDAFLRANPDLPAFTASLPEIHAGPLEFPLKGALRKDHPPAGTPDATRLDDFLIARTENDLSAEQENALDRFLYEDPEAEKQAALMALAVVPNHPILFPAKETVKRHFPPQGTPDAHRLTDFLIADLEGDLPKDQRLALKLYVAEHLEAEREERLVAATRTLPVLIPFAGKEDLKRREVRTIPLWSRLAVAASFLLLLGAGWWLLEGKPEERKEVARVEKPVELPPISPRGSELQPVVTDEPTATKDQPLALKAPRNTTLKSATGTASGATPSAIQPSSKTAPTPEQMPEYGDRRNTKPVPDPLLAQEPQLAEHMDVVATAPNSAAGVDRGTAAQGSQVAAAPSSVQGSGQDLGTFVANTVRGQVLETPKRGADLDGKDVLAFADKAIGAVTGGKGGVSVQHNSAGQKFQLRLGRNFSLSASRGR